VIIGDRPEVRLIYLCGSRALSAERLAGRHGHFMPSDLLLSQVDTLDEPGPEEDPLIIDIGPPARQVAKEIIRLLSTSQRLSGTANVQDSAPRRPMTL